MPSTAVQDTKNVQPVTGKLYYLNISSILIVFIIDALHQAALSMPNIPNPSNVLPLSLNNLSSTTQVPSITSVSMGPPISYEQPEIVNELKKEYHLRYMRDVGTPQMPLLAGDGPQRTPIQVKVG
jgi:hypothetical protein